MENQKEKVDSIFGPQMAANYDSRPEVWQAGRQSMLGFVQVLLAELPPRAHLLCVGSGTGSEVEPLAAAFPEWRFTLVEPSSAMMGVCRERFEAAGLAQRCTFHEGFLGTLPQSGPFDAATCFLVSHFITDRAQRVAFFANIAARVRPGALLLSSDLASDMHGEQFHFLLGTFLRSLAPQLSEEEIDSRRVVYGRDVALLPPEEIEAILVEAGFSPPIRFFQNLLIHGWFARRK